MVLFELKEVEDVRVPRFEVDGDASLALAASLIDVARRGVKDAQHRHEAVGSAVGAPDVRLGGTDVVHREPDAASILGDLRALLERVVNALDGVVLHGEKEARRELRLRRACVEERRRRMGVELLRHELIHLQGGIEVVLVDADGHSHEHLLRPLNNDAIALEKVRALERLEAKVVVLEVALVVHGGIEALRVGHDDLIDIVRDERGQLVRLWVHVRVELLDGRREGIQGVLVEVGHGDTRSEDGVVRVLRRHVCCRLRR